MSRASGRQIGPYEIRDLLGAGGMGMVYRARDHRLGRDVALKVLLPELANDPQALSRFEREVRAVAMLSHPNILAIYDFEREGETVYAAMELLNGPTLRQRINDGPLPPRKAVEAAVQIAGGLAAAHERNLVHRDLKPENLAFTADGRVKILDFGLTREYATRPHDDSPTQSRPTSPGLIAGTVGYMSPEQLRGQDVDHRSDLFALGAVLYEMMTGRRAFAGETVADITSAILKDETKDLADSGVGVPPALDSVVRRCLEKNASERFQSARDLAFALENATNAGVQDVQVSAPPRRSRWLRAALQVTIGLAAGVALALWLRPGREAGFDYQVRELTQSGVDSAPSASRDGASVAFGSMRTGSPTIWTRAPTGSETQLTVGPDRNPRYSADGQYVYFIRGDGVWRVDSRGGAATSVLSGMPGLVEVDPSPDGRWLAYQRFETASGENGSRRIFGILGIAATTPSAPATELLRTQDALLVSARWSPDGTEIAVVRYVEGRSESEVVVVDAATASPRVLKAINGTYGALTWNGDGRTLIVTETVMTTEVYAPGASGRIVVLDSRTGERRTLFPQSNLLGLFWDPLSNSRIDVAGPGRLVFDRVETRQTLQELRLDGASHAVRDLTRGTGLDRQPDYAPDGSSVVFTSGRTGNLDLYLVTTSDGRLYPLTVDPAQDWDPGFTPDGEQLVWSSDRSGHLEIWIADIGRDSTGTPVLSNYRQLSSDGVIAENPTMTANGEWVVYASRNPGNPGIWRVRSDGTDAKVLVTGSRNYNPEVSPNGRFALFIEEDRYRYRSTICVVEIETGRLDDFVISVDDIRNMQNANITRGRARWASDDRIVFVGHDEKTGTVGIFEQAFRSGQDTSSTRRRLVASDPESGRLTESFDISPNGSRITVSFASYTRNVMVASGVPGIEPPRRSGR